MRTSGDTDCDSESNNYIDANTDADNDNNAYNESYIQPHKNAYAFPFNPRLCDRQHALEGQRPSPCHAWLAQPHPF